MTPRTDEPPADLHVLPINDTRAHVEVIDCWCAPRIEGDAPPHVIVHHAADRREWTERAPARRTARHAHKNPS